jgi:hypothetical protein
MMGSSTRTDTHLPPIAPRGALLFMVILPLLAGCTFGRLQIGHPLDAGAESDLYSGQAQMEVLERLGPPDRVTMDWDEAVFEYFYREDLDRELDVSVFQASFDYEQIWLRADRLVVRFDAAGHVRDYGINLQTGASD